MSTRGLIRTFERWRQTGEPMVLATVYDTIGSTYSKAGHRILIAANGDYQGLVSGGCLEGDLAERARSVIETGEPLAISFDMRDEADDLWGLGVGCNGLIRVFLQPLTEAKDYQPFSGIARSLLDATPAVVATVIAGADGDGLSADGGGLSPGATLIWKGGDAGADEGGLPPGVTLSWNGGDDEDGLPPGATLSRNGGDAATGPLTALVAGCREARAAGRAIYRREPSGAVVLYAPIKPVRRLLVLGAGLDAVPVVNMATELGWRVTVADHRPAYLEKGVFEAAEDARLIDPARMSNELAPERFDAIIVMSHHLMTDQAYLEQLAEVPAGYLGVLGPKDRRERLLSALGDADKALEGRLKGPVGLDIGADDPESIALSLLAEMHAVLAGASGRTLTAAD